MARRSFSTPQSVKYSPHPRTTMKEKETGQMMSRVTFIAVSSYPVVAVVVVVVVAVVTQ